MPFCICPYVTFSLLFFQIGLECLWPAMSGGMNIKVISQSQSDVCLYPAAWSLSLKWIPDSSTAPFPVHQCSFLTQSQGTPHTHHHLVPLPIRSCSKAPLSRATWYNKRLACTLTEAPQVQRETMEHVQHTVVLRYRRENPLDLRTLSTSVPARWHSNLCETSSWDETPTRTGLLVNTAWGLVQKRLILCVLSTQENVCSPPKVQMAMTFPQCHWLRWVTSAKSWGITPTRTWLQRYPRTKRGLHIQLSALHEEPVSQGKSIWPLWRHFGSGEGQSFVVFKSCQCPRTLLIPAGFRCRKRWMLLWMISVTALQTPWRCAVKTLVSCLTLSAHKAQRSFLLYTGKKNTSLLDTMFFVRPKVVCVLWQNIWFLFLQPIQFTFKRHVLCWKKVTEFKQERESASFSLFQLPRSPSCILLHTNPKPDYTVSPCWHCSPTLQLFSLNLLPSSNRKTQ